MTVIILWPPEVQPTKEPIHRSENRKVQHRSYYKAKDQDDRDGKAPPPTAVRLPADASQPKYYNEHAEYQRRNEKCGYPFHSRANNYSTNRFVVRGSLFQHSSFPGEVNCHEALIPRSAMSTPVGRPALSRHSGQRPSGARAGSGFLQAEQVFAAITIALLLLHYGFSAKGYSSIRTILPTPGTDAARAGRYTDLPTNSLLRVARRKQY